MKRCHTLRARAAVLLTTLLASVALADSQTLLSQNFDSDAAGKLPAGWKLSESQTFTAAIQSDAAAPSGKNVLKLVSSGTAPTASEPEPTLVATFQPHDLDGKHGPLEYSLDINVESIAGDNSEGLQLRISAITSRIDAASPRILRGDKEWRLFTGAATPDGINYFGRFAFNKWVKLRFVIEPTSTKAGKVYWYADGTLINTEVYADRNETQTLAVQRLEISPVHAPENSNTVVLIDNVRVAAGGMK